MFVSADIDKGIPAPHSPFPILAWLMCDSHNLVFPCYYRHESCDESCDADKEGTSDGISAWLNCSC